MHRPAKPSLQQLRAKLRRPEPFKGAPGQFLRACEAGTGGRAAGTLGTFAKSSSPPPLKASQASLEKSPERRRELRFERFELLSEGRRLFLHEGRRADLAYWHTVHRTAGCNWLRHGDVQVHQKEGRAHYSGLIHCGSVWACPVCSAKIQEQRRQEIATAVDWAYAEGLQPVLVTLTFPHRSWHQIDDLLEQQRDALTRLRSGKAWQKLKGRYGFQGLVRSLEITHGQNGWHPHTHELWFISKNADAAALAGEVRKRWRSSCQRAGLLDEGDAGFDEHAVDVKAWCSASDYLAKQDDSRHWGVDREVAKGGAKSAKGMHPFGLLRRSMDGCERSGRLFTAYAFAMKGKRQVFWSHGLKARVGVAEVDDQAVAEAVPDDIEFLGQLEPQDWALVRELGQRAQLLDVAEKGGWAAVDAFLSDLWATGGRKPPAPAARSSGFSGREAPRIGVDYPVDCAVAVPAAESFSLPTRGDAAGRQLGAAQPVSYRFVPDRSDGAAQSLSRACVLPPPD